MILKTQISRDLWSTLNKSNPKIRSKSNTPSSGCSTALIIQGYRRIRRTTVRITADKIQLTGSNRKDPTPTKQPSKPPPDNKRSRDDKEEDGECEPGRPLECIQMTSTWIAKTSRKRREEMGSEERNDWLLRKAQSVRRTSMWYSTAALAICFFPQIHDWR